MTGSNLTDGQYHDHCGLLAQTIVDYALASQKEAAPITTALMCVRLLKALGMFDPEQAMSSLNEVDKIVHDQGSYQATRLRLELPKVVCEWETTPAFDKKSLEQLGNCLASNHGGHNAQYKRNVELAIAI